MCRSHHVVNCVCDFFAKRHHTVQGTEQLWCSLQVHFVMSCHVVSGVFVGTTTCCTGKPLVDVSDFSDGDFAHHTIPCTKH